MEEDWNCCDPQLFQVKMTSIVGICVLAANLMTYISRYRNNKQVTPTLKLQMSSKLDYLVQTLGNCLEITRLIYIYKSLDIAHNHWTQIKYITCKSHAINQFLITCTPVHQVDDFHHMALRKNNLKRKQQSPLYTNKSVFDTIQVETKSTSWFFAPFLRTHFSSRPCGWSLAYFSIRTPRPSLCHCPIDSRSFSQLKQIQINYIIHNW